MAVTIYAYSHFKYNAYKKLISDLASGSTELKLMLTTSEYTPDIDNHDSKADVTNEVSGTGYTAGGKVLTGVTFILTADEFVLDAANPEWTGSTITARRAELYDNTPAAAADKKLILVIDFGVNKVSDNSTFRIKWANAGILKG